MYSIHMINSDKATWIINQKLMLQTFMDMGFNKFHSRTN